MSAITPSCDAGLPTMPPLNSASQSYTARPSPVTRLAPRLLPGPQPKRRAGSASDLRSMTINGNGADLVSGGSCWSLDEHSPNPLFDDDDLDNDVMADSVQSLDQEVTQPVPDTKVVQAMEEALNNIIEDSQHPTAEDLRASLFGSEDASSSMFSGGDNASARGSLDLPRPAQPEHPAHQAQPPLKGDEQPS